MYNIINNFKANCYITKIITLILNLSRNIRTLTKNLSRIFRQEFKVFTNNLGSRILSFKAN